MGGRGLRQLPTLPPEGERLIDAAAAAELLGVSKSWVIDQARRGRIPHVRLGRFVRFEPTQLRTWWVGRRHGPGTGPWPR